MCIVRRSPPRWFAGAVYLSIVAAGATALPRLAVAQSLFDQLFGWSGSKQQIGPAARPPMAGIGGQPLPMRQQFSRPTDEAPSPNERSGGRSEKRTGQYRTVCVRMCDGFFFPISHTASRSNFHDDAESCRSRCGSSDAKLFYHANSGEIGDAVDLGGRSYKSLSTAFLYRKKLVDGCACKPMPWSEAEAGRHLEYALAEGRTIQPSKPPGEGVKVVAGVYSTAADLASAAEIPIAVQPDPIEQPIVAARSPRIASAATPPKGIGARRDPNAEQRAERAEPKPNAQAKPARTASAATPPSPPPRRPANMVQSALSSGNKFTWPGDAPNRYR